MNFLALYTCVILRRNCFSKGYKFLSQLTYVMDLINGLVEILRLETEELRSAAWEALAPVKP